MRGLRMETANRIAGRIADRIRSRRMRVTKMAWEPVVGRYRKTRVPCSCEGCGNPRRHHNLRTLQELKAEIDEREQLELLAIGLALDEAA